jgi:hypothetical protein
MKLQRRLVMFTVAICGVVVLFMLTSLPYAQFTWADMVADYVTEPEATREPVVLVPVTDADPATNPPTFVEVPPAALPEQAQLFAPEVPVAKVGIPALLDRGIVAAFDYLVFIDGRVSTAPFEALIEVCIKGKGGAMVFLAADQAPRVPAPLRILSPKYPGYTCALIDRPGTVVLLEK